MTRNKDDERELYDLLGTEEERKSLDVQFKNPKSNFKIAIVVDMWITGFDVPCLDTMYIDKPLQQHTLIQTISRVNRVYPGKDKGLVVDYIGIKNNLNTALKRYANGNDEDAGSVEAVEHSIIMVKDELDILRRMFGNFNYSKFSTGTPLEQLDCLNKGAEYAQTTKEMENQFMGHTKKLKSAFNLCSNSEQITQEEREDIHFFCGIRSISLTFVLGIFSLARRSIYSSLSTSKFSLSLPIWIISSTPSDWIASSIISPTRLFICSASGVSPLVSL